MRDLVSRSERVVGRELHINSRIKVCARARVRNGLGYARDH